MNCLVFLFRALIKNTRQDAQSIVGSSCYPDMMDEDEKWFVPAGC
jgi:hypothetical protein